MDQILYQQKMILDPAEWNSSEFFNSSNGLQQGEPLSMLFILVMEAESEMME